MGEREPGPYWVRIDGEWEVATLGYTVKNHIPVWLVAGSNRGENEDTFDEIGPRCIAPDQYAVFSSPLTEEMLESIKNAPPGLVVPLPTYAISGEIEHLKSRIADLEGALTDILQAEDPHSDYDSGFQAANIARAALGL